MVAVLTLTVGVDGVGVAAGSDVEVNVGMAVGAWVACSVEVGAASVAFDGRLQANMASIRTDTAQDNLGLIFTMTVSIFLAYSALTRR